MKRSHIIMMVLALGCFVVTMALAGAPASQETHKTAGDFPAKTLYDYEVLNPNHKVVGTIADLVITPEGYIKYIFLSPASWWGSRDRLYVIPWISLTPHRDQKSLVLNFSQERLQKAPSFARNNRPNMANANWDAAYQQYYGQQRMAQQAMQPAAVRGQRQGPKTLIDTDVLFNFGEARLHQQARDTLDNLVAQLKNTDFGTIHLTGHADRIGSDEVNFNLARRRAERVAAYLVEHGIDPTQIRTLSLGEEVPITTGPEAGRPVHERRVDIVVEPPSMAATAPMERTGTARQESRRQSASQPGTGVSARLSGTVLGVDRDHGTVAVSPQYGDTIELRAHDALLHQLMQGESVEVRLRKIGPTPQQSGASQLEHTSEQQAQ